MGCFYSHGYWNCLYPSVCIARLYVYVHACVILRFIIFSILSKLPNLRILLHVYEHMHTYVSVGSCFLWECLACARLVFFSGPASRAAIEAGEGG